MMLKIYLIAFFFSFFVIKTVFANDKNDIWYFYKVSKKTVLGEFDPTRESLIDNFADTKIIFEEKKIIVDGICSFEYIKHSKTPVSYWMSEKTAKLYQNLFLQENVPLKDKIEVITNLWSDDQCPSPFNNFIKKDDYLVTVTEQGYLLFFSQNQNDRQLSSTYRGLHRDLNILGHPLVRDKKIGNKINKECDYPADGTYGEGASVCDNNELGIYFGRLIENINQEKFDINKTSQHRYYLSKKQINENDDEVTLHAAINNKVIDSIVLYKSKTGETAISNQYYYIDEQIDNIWLLEIIADDESTKASSWKHYKIDHEGQFKLIESISYKN